jgi:hypothetical protein
LKGLQVNLTSKSRNTFVLAALLVTIFLSQITGRRQKELDEAVKAIGSNVAGVQGDISKLTDVDCLYEAVKSRGEIECRFRQRRRR